MSQIVIETNQISRRFGPVWAVDALDLQVPRGSVYGFLGPNGAGKTSTIRMLLGLLRPSRGQISILGKPSTKHLENLSRIGALVESPAFYPHLTGRENLELFRRMRGIGTEPVTQVLALVRLAEDADRPAAHYSLGMRQRLALALALLDQPELLILDEPTNGLDPAGIREIRQLLRSLPQERGITVFLSSHLLGEVELIASHIGIIQDGRLLFQGTQEELQSRLDVTLILESDQPAKARQMLSSAGWQVEYAGGQLLKLSVNGPSDAAMINAQLVSAGLPVSRLQIERPSLEDIFLRLTGDASPPAGLTTTSIREGHLKQKDLNDHLPETIPMG